MDEQQPARHGHQWDEDDYFRLAAGARAGLSVLLVAVELQRTPSAVVSRLRQLGAVIDLDDVELLEAIVDDPGFDLPGLAREEHARRRMPFWTAVMDAELRQAWEDQDPTVDLLAERLGVRPSQVIDRLVLRRYARNTVDAVDRLGVDPDSDLGVRMRLAADKTSVMLWALVLTNVAGEPVHVSLHAQHGIAHAELDELRPDPDSAPDPDGPRFWAILPRVAGELTPRAGERGAFDLPAVVKPEPTSTPEPPRLVATRTRRPRAPRKPRRIVEDDLPASPRASAGSRVEPDY